MDKVIITDLCAQGIIGVKYPERATPQDLLVNIILFMDLSAAGRTDDIADTINYSTVSKRVAAEITATSYFTVEALAVHLAHVLLINFPVDEITVRVEKPNRVRNTARVGVEITRSRSDFGM